MWYTDGSHQSRECPHPWNCQWHCHDIAMIDSFHTSMIVSIHDGSMIDDNWISFAGRGKKTAVQWILVVLTSQGNTEQLFISKLSSGNDFISSGSRFKIVVLQPMWQGPSAVNFFDLSDHLSGQLVLGLIVTSFFVSRRCSASRSFAQHSVDLRLIVPLRCSILLILHLPIRCACSFRESAQLRFSRLKRSDPWSDSFCQLLSVSGCIAFADTSD